ncbi:MAG: MoxR family ATPase [Leptospiraceae bacterium]|nr:MoxR family ATPase [Leptospiraceae bacterium]MCK6381328.1 MoxR family ATPase [Leptospiraceae bacterium]NUM42851.1 MoxR family ATPase [Leptospiraceae bacterium]
MSDPREDFEKYILSNELGEAVKIAEITERPLLVKGEPGTGKTLLAHYVSTQKKMPLFRWHVKSTSEAKEGLYFYDAVARLNDSRFSEIDSKKDIHNIENYIRLGALGEAFESDVKPIVLIDEIDKADIEFPNDLLLELDSMEFFITETNRKVKAKHRPLIIITSNNEKELPDAFLRRCIFHYIDFPSKEFMESIVKSHFPEIDKDILKKAIETFYSLRKSYDLKKKPSTSELIDWIHILLHQGADWKKTNIPYLGTLVKNEEDYEVLKGR